MSSAGTAAPSTVSVVTTDLGEIISVISTVVGAFVPGVSLLGFTLSQIVTIATGVINGVPAMVTLWSEIQAVFNSGAAPTAAQWSSWNQAADAAYSTLEADIAAAQASTQTT